MRRSVIGLIVTLALSILLAPLASDSQAAKVPLIGFLTETDLATTATVLEPFRHGLRARGYVEGQTIVLEARRAEGMLDRLPDLATELVQRQVDLLVAVVREQSKQRSTRPGRFPLWPSWVIRWRWGWWPASRGPAGTSQG